MPTKKQPSKKTKSGGKPKPRAYSCSDAPTKPMGLSEIVKKIVAEKEFADFIREQLCKSNGGDSDATKCLEKYYKSNRDDLAALGVNADEMETSLVCTEQNRLLDAVAYVYSGKKC